MSTRGSDDVRICTSVWYREIEQKLELSRYAPWTIVSCETGLRKPDIRAYQNACRLLDVAAEQCLFVDDRTKNCRGAEAACKW